MVGDMVDRHPFFYAAITVDIKMPAVTRLATRVDHFFTPYSSHCQIRQLRTMNDHKVNIVGTTALQAVDIRQGTLLYFQAQMKITLKS